MKWADLFLYLIGNRGAIERIATSRRALWAGALLVVSAGIARNYDHLHLLAQPEWIYGPFGMSLLSAVLIWMMLRSDISFSSPNAKHSAFRTFLTFFWLTAPCAWLYGFPVERITDLVGATQWNFAFLILVAAWRVALIVRAVTVLTGAAVGRVTAFVLLPACVEMFAGSLLKGLSLIGIMGGVRLPPHHVFLKNASDIVVTGSLWLGICCLIAVLVYCFKTAGRAVRPLWREGTTENRGALIAASACLVLWILMAIPAQGPVSQNYQLSRYFAKQQWREGIAFAAARQRSDFSPIHFLPPDPYGRRFGNSYVQLLEAMDGSEPEWLREVWSSQAFMELELSMIGRSSDGNTVQVLSRYPSIMNGLLRKADRLRARTQLGEDDEGWLQRYEEMFGQADSTKNVPP